jgi:predicted enzyme related to lactoylglutathione lyase
VTTTSTYTLKQPIPVLSVLDVQEACDFFCNKLGFGDSWVHEGFYGGVSKDGHHVHFSKCDQVSPSTIYNFVDNVDAVHASVTAASVEIITPLTDQFYGMRDFTVKDPSGNSIAFSSAIAK